jgi:hypothetical protein
LVPLDELITPQWWIDSEYVETLAARAPEPGDLAGLFDFAFPIGHLEMPMAMGPFAWQFASAKPEFAGTSPLRITHYSPDKITMQFDVVPRPNWLWIAACAGVSRPLITNGVHHLLALLKAGHKEAVCLIRPAQSPDDMQLNFQDPGFLPLYELGSSRPPLLQDYLDEQHAADVAWHARWHSMQVAVVAEPGIHPAVPGPRS